eukprot:scaffold295_cov257-Pinguiococcus_pyrenoidosus.AAC.2
MGGNMFPKDLALPDVPPWLLLSAVVLGLLLTWMVLPVMFSGGKFRQVPDSNVLFGQIEPVLRPQDVISIFEGFCQKYGLCEFRMGTKRFVLLDDWKDVNRILKLRPRVVTRPRIQKEVMDQVAPGLFSAEVPEWGMERRIVSPAFSHTNLSGYVRDIRMVTERMVRIIEDRHSAASNINEMLEAWIEDVIALVGFGQDFNNLEGQSSHSPLIRKLIATFAFRCMVGSSIPYYRIPIVGPMLDGGAYCGDRIAELMDDVLQRARRRQGPATTILDKFIEKNREENGALSDQRLKGRVSPHPLDAYAVLLLTQHAGERAGNAFTLFAAGSDTSAITAAWMFYHLARDAQLQQDTRNEALAADLSDDLSFAEIIQRLPILRSLFQEVLRVSGPTPFLLLENPKTPVEVAGKVGDSAQRCGTTVKKKSTPGDSNS